MLISQDQSLSVNVQDKDTLSLTWQTLFAVSFNVLLLESIEVKIFINTFMSVYLRPLFQLRYLQTLNSIAAEHNSTIIFPMPINLANHLFKRWDVQQDTSSKDIYYIKNSEVVGSTS